MRSDNSMRSDDSIKGDNLIDDSIRGDTMRSNKSDRKVLSHSRIIKTFNPTAGLQTKIITYPDLS
jgi:hypothetical protein